MATRRSEWLAAIKPILDKDAAKKDAVSLAKELGDILEVKVDASPENLDDLTKEFNEQLKTMGKQPIVFSEKTLRGIVSQFTNAIAKGVSNGVASIDFTAELESLKKQKSELLKEQADMQKKIKNRSRIEKLNKFEIESANKLKIDGDISEQAEKMLDKMYEHADRISELLSEQGKESAEYIEAVLDGQEAYNKFLRMRKTLLETKPDLPKDTKAAYGLFKGADMDNYKAAGGTVNPFEMDEYGGLIIIDAFEELSDALMDAEHPLGRIQQKINEIDAKIENITRQAKTLGNEEILNSNSLKNGLKTLDEIQEKYKEFSKNLAYQHKQSLESNINYTPRIKDGEIKDGIATFAENYNEAVASGDWTKEYGALLKYVRLYESYLEKGTKAQQNKITKKNNPFTQLYEQLKPMAENAENMLKNVVNMIDGKPLVGMGGAEKEKVQASSIEANNAEKTAEAQKISAEEEAQARADAEKKAQIEKEALADAEKRRQIEKETEESLKQQRIEGEKIAKARKKAAEDAERESIAKAGSEVAKTGINHTEESTYTDNINKSRSDNIQIILKDMNEFLSLNKDKKGTDYFELISSGAYKMSEDVKIAIESTIGSIDSLKSIKIGANNLGGLIGEKSALILRKPHFDREKQKWSTDEPNDNAIELQNRLSGVNISDVNLGKIQEIIKSEEYLAELQNKVSGDPISTIGEAIEAINLDVLNATETSVKALIQTLRDLYNIGVEVDVENLGNILYDAQNDRFGIVDMDVKHDFESAEEMINAFAQAVRNQIEDIHETLKDPKMAQSWSQFANMVDVEVEKIKPSITPQLNIDDNLKTTMALLEKEKLTYEDILALVKEYNNESLMKELSSAGNWDEYDKIFAHHADIAKKLVPTGMLGIGSDSPDKWLATVGMSAETAAQRLKELYDRMHQVSYINDELSDSFNEDTLFDKTVKALEKSNDAFDDYERELASSGQESIDKYRNNLSIYERARRLIEEGFVDQNTEWVDNDEYEYEDIKKENGALEDKLELLRDIAEQYGMNISQKQRDAYERLNQKDMDSGLTPKEDERYWELGEQIEEADNALEEFGETYDKIIVKLANGRKVEILPNDKGLSALAKIDDEFGETYNGVEIDDVIFERVKQEASGAEQSVDELNKSLEETHKLTSAAGTGAFSGDASSIELEAAQAEAEKLRLENDSLQDRLQSQADAMADEAYRNQEARGELYEMISNAEAERDAEKNRADSLQTELDQKSKEFTDKISYLETEVNFKDSEINDAYARAYESDAEAERLRDELARVKSSSKPEDAVEDKQSSVDTEELKTLLNSIVYNVKIAHDDADNVANKVALDEASLEITLTKVLTSILNPQTQQNDSNLDGRLSEIKSVLDSINDKIAKGGTITKKDKDVSRKTNDDSNNQSGRSTALKTLTGDYERLGKLRAQFEKDGNLETKARLKNLAEEVESKRNSLKLTVDEILRLKEKSDLAYKAEQRLIEAAKVQKEIDNQRKEDARNTKKQEKDAENAWKKQVKDAQRATGVNAATSAANSGDQTVLRAIGTEDISADIENKAKELSVQIKELRALRDEIDKKGEQASDADRDSLSKQITKVKELKTEVDGYLKIHEKYSGEGAKQFNDIDTSSFGAVGTNQYWNSITAAIKTVSDGRVAIKGMNADTGELSGTTKIAANTFATWSATVDPITGKLSILRTGIKKTETIIEQITRKTKEIFTYFSGSSIIFKAFNELKKGIQYIRDIDLALTELKKVTDETDETYDKFLETAAKTGAKLGTTISAVTEATATFAKLGYTMEQATEMAEAAIVYKNVGDNIASTGDAADSIISTMKGFGLEASESMAIVDRFNEVGE